jgi:hypothetical protein
LIGELDDIERLVSALRVKDAEIRQMAINWKEAECKLAESWRRWLDWTLERDKVISDLERTIRNLKQQTADQDNRLQELQEQFAMAATENGGRADRIVLNMRGSLTVHEEEAIVAFSNAPDLDAVCQATGLCREDVFQIAQKRFCPPQHARPPANENILPLNGAIDREALISAVRGSSFLFWTAVFDACFACAKPHDLAVLFAFEFEDFGQFQAREWPLKAAFVLELIFSGVLDDKTAVDNLEEEIAALKSLRGRLTRICRTMKAQHSEAASTAKAEIHQLRAQLARQEKHRLAEIGELALSEQFQTRTAILKELIELAKGEAANRYSQQLYHMLVRVLFRSYSAYKFLRNFLTLPSPTAIYSHFHDQIDASLARLTHVELVGEYLSSQISTHPVFADAVSCSNSFIGVKKVEHSDTGHLFVVLLQPVSSAVRCSPLFVIKSQSGTGNQTIQTEIDIVLGIVQ